MTQEVPTANRSSSPLRVPVATMDRHVSPMKMRTTISRSSSPINWNKRQVVDRGTSPPVKPAQVSREVTASLPYSREDEPYSYSPAPLDPLPDPQSAKTHGGDYKPPKVNAATSPLFAKMVGKKSSAGSAVNQESSIADSGTDTDDASKMQDPLKSLKSNALQAPKPERRRSTSPVLPSHQAAVSSAQPNAPLVPSPLMFLPDKQQLIYKSQTEPILGSSDSSPRNTMDMPMPFGAKKRPDPYSYPLEPLAPLPDPKSAKTHGGDYKPPKVEEKFLKKCFGYLARCEFWLKLRSQDRILGFRV